MAGGSFARLLAIDAADDGDTTNDSYNVPLNNPSPFS
jgi:hypothetical protein